MLKVFFLSLLAFIGNLTTAPIILTLTQSNSTPAVQISKPVAEYPTLRKAKNSLPFYAKNFGAQAGNYTPEAIQIIEGKLLEIVYQGGDNQVIYRTAQGIADISGDCNTYEQSATVTIAHQTVTIKGENDQISLAIWHADEISYSLSFIQGVDLPTVTNIVQHLI